MFVVFQFLPVDRLRTIGNNGLDQAMDNTAVFIEFDFRYQEMLFLPGWINGGPFTVE